MKKKIMFFCAGVLLFFILFSLWYIVAANYDYKALAGTYVFQGSGETCTLYLRADQTFVQELSHSGNIQKAEGHWDRYGEAHVSFSRDFLKVSGEEFNASGQAHGEFQKAFGVFPELVMAPLPNGPTFRKKWFH